VRLDQGRIEVAEVGLQPHGIAALQQVHRVLPPSLVECKFEPLIDFIEQFDALVMQSLEPATLGVDKQVFIYVETYHNDVIVAIVAFNLPPRAFLRIEFFEPTSAAR